MWGQTVSKQPTVWDIMARLAQEAEEQGQPSPVLDHTAPGGPLTADQAHLVMQTHRACDRWVCMRKASAWAVLVAAGRIVPRPANGAM
ncbi:hypothetical protein ACIA5E_26870 [Nocardia asteroides]|uniref:hypothetical protein n=1 Tax=Nocardia asteroides TaxID=1824 RepID=UPI0037BB32D0